MAESSKKRGDTWIFDLRLTRPNVQTVTIEGSPTNGTWTITYTDQEGVLTGVVNGVEVYEYTYTTAPIAHNANAAAVQTALETLPNVAAGDVTVTGGPGPATPWVVTINTAGAYVLAVAGSFTGGSGVNIHVDQAAYNLTGATLYVTFKTNVAVDDDAEGVKQYSWIDAGAASGITVATPTAGVAVLTIPDSDTADWLLSKYFYDVQVTDASGRTSTPDSGTLTVTADVTRTTP